MVRRISDWLRRVSKGGLVLTSLGIFLLFSALVLPGQAREAESYAGEAGSPDTSFFYSAADLYRMADAYGERGRQAYVRARFTFDLIWPMVYTLFLTTAISWVSLRAFADYRLWHRANLLPVLGMLFDYLENISTSVVMLRYPDQTALIDQLAPGFTILKWLCIAASFALLIIGSLAGFWRWVRRGDQSAREG